MNLKTITIVAIPLLLLLMGTATTNQAKAWDGGLGNCGFGCGYHHNWGGGGCGNGNGCGDNGGGIGNLLGGFQNLWSGIGNGGGGYYNVGYQEGTQDAIYDHQNNLAYSNQPSCISCHSQSYLDGFKHAYDQQWNSYQVQNTEQKSNIYINGNNNYVNTAQTNNQGQNQPSPTGPSTGGCGLESCNPGPSCGFGCGP